MEYNRYEVDCSCPDGTVFIVDDDADVRNLVSLVARSAGLVTETFSSASDFFNWYDAQKPGCLVLDVCMPEMSGLELQRCLRANEVWLPIIFLTGHGEIPLATQAMRAGAVDFIAKPFRSQVLLERIHEAIGLDRKNRRKRASASDVEQRLGKLTAREREIMDLLAAGQTTKHIAQCLSISSKTADNHRAKVLSKMGVDNPTQLSLLIATIK